MKKTKISAKITKITKLKIKIIALQLTVFVQDFDFIQHRNLYQAQ